MTRKSMVISSSYAAVARGIRELHSLALAGKHESPEADVVRDAMDVPWSGLSEIERRRASGLSEDLYSIADSGSTAPRETNPQAQARLNDAIEAGQRGEWDRSLELLRRWSTYISPALLSYLRGSVWHQAGDADTAVLFLEHASSLAPENGIWFAKFLLALEEVDPVKARRRAEDVLRTHETADPVAVLQAADVIIFRATQSLPSASAIQEISSLIRVLELAFERIKPEGDGSVDSRVYSFAVSMLGFAHQVTGQTQAAADYYSRGLQVAPDDNGLLVARGMLLYGSSPTAITDLELAIPSPAVWPYFLLAHDCLASRRFEECISMCVRASQKTELPAIQSELADWAAICKAELGFPAESVRSAFENAIRLYPSNERARRNLAAFDDGTRKWVMRSRAEVRAVGQAERRYAMAA